MEWMSKFKKCYSISDSIIDYYNRLFEMINENKQDSDEFNNILDIISRLTVIEIKQYDKLTMDEIKCIWSEFEQIPSSKLSLCDIRVINKLHISYDKLTKNCIRNNNLFEFLDENELLSIADIVNSKIMIDSFKLMLKKISELECNSDYEKKLKKEFLLYIMQHALFKLSIGYASEKLSLKNGYNISKIESVDLNQIEDQIFDATGNKPDLIVFARDNIFADFMDFLNLLENANFDTDDLENIYDNLYFITYMEVIIKYLNKEQLAFVSSYINGINFNNKLIANNIRRLVKTEQDEVFNDKNCE